MVTPASPAARPPAPRAPSTRPPDSPWLAALFVGLALASGLGIAALIMGLAGSVFWIVLLVTGAAVAGLTVLRPEYGLIFLILIAYTQFSRVISADFGTPPVLRPFAVFLLGVVVVRWIVLGRRPIGWEGSALLLACYGLVGAASGLYATDAARAQAAALDYAKDLAMIFAMLILVQRVDQFRGIVWALLLAGVGMAGISVFQTLTQTYANTYLGFGGIATEEAGNVIARYRVTGPFANPNAYAQVLVVLIPLAVDRLRVARERWAAAFSLLLILLAIVFTYSRGGLLAAATVSGLVLLQRQPRLSGLLLIAGVAALLLQTLPANYLDRVTTLTELWPSNPRDLIVDPSFRGRVSETEVAWRVFNDHPLLGVGLNNYPVYYQAYSSDIGFDPRREERSPASLYLQVLAEQGLVGITFFLLLLGFTFRELGRGVRALQAAGQTTAAGLLIAFRLGLFGYLVLGLFKNNAYATTFWLLMALALAMAGAALRHAAAPAEAKPTPEARA